MGKEKADAPDYRGAAQEEAQASRENLEQQTWANRPTQINPWGQIDWTNAPEWDPTTNQYINRWTQQQTLDPGLQSALDAQIALQGGRSQLGASMMGDIAADLGSGMDFDRFGSLTNVSSPYNVTTEGLTEAGPSDLQRTLDYSGASQVGDPEFTRQSAEDSLWNRQKQRLDQQFAGDREALEIKLANRGLRPGDQAWDSAIANENQRKTDAYQGAQAQAMQLGGQEAQRMFDMQSALRGQQTGEQQQMGDFANRAGLSQYGMMADARNRELQEQIRQNQFNQGQQYQFADYQNQLRQQAMNEELMRRNQRLNEASALTSGQQVAQTQFQPFQGAGQAQTPQYLNAASLQGQQAAADASVNNAAFGNAFGGLTSLGLGMMGI